MLWGILGAIASYFIILSLVSPGPPRDAAIRVACAINLQQIGRLICAYRSDHSQRFPSDLGLLMTNQSLSARALACPNLRYAKSQPPAQQAGTILYGGNSSYVYVGAGLSRSAGASEVAAFELPENHAKAGGNVLWGDGHVTWEGFDTLVQLVPELEAGRNPPVIRPLTAAQAKTIYDQKWAPKVASIKDGTWAASLPRPATRPAAQVK